MTRENKLALIVAFALILGVSVLLSDHLSSARSTEPGQIHETSRLPQVPDRPIRTLDDVVRDARLTPPTPQSGEPATRGEGPMLIASDPRGNSALASDEPTILDNFLNALASAPGALSPELVGGSHGSPAPVIHEPLANQGADGPLVLDQRLARRGDSQTPPAGAAPATSNAAPTNNGNPATTDPVRNHSVRSGESLYSIAAKYYGNGNLWRDLARHNTGRIKPDGTVNSGVTLRIPSRADLTGRPVVAGTTPATSPNTTPTAPPATPPATPARPANRSRSYTVASGDTLGDISRSTLGTSRRWREIYELNKDSIADPDNVRAGTVLKIPAT